MKNGCLDIKNGGGGGGVFRQYKTNEMYILCTQPSKNEMIVLLHFHLKVCADH